MKKLCFLGLLVLLLMILSVPKSFAQAEAERFETSFVITDTDTGEQYTFTAPGTQVLTPSGNFQKSIKIRIPKDHDLMKGFGPYPNRYFQFVYMFLDMGDEGYHKSDGDVILIDAIAILNKSGNLSIDFHKNGAGNYLPKGW